MNRIYKTVFNRRLGVWQAVSELARGGGKASTTASADQRTLVQAIGGAILLAGAVAPLHAHADTIVGAGTTTSSQISVGLGTVTNIQVDSGGTASGGIFNLQGTIVTLLNNGTVSGQPAIANQGSITTLNNGGLISGTAYGLENSGNSQIGSLINSGTIQGAVYGIINSGFGGSVTIVTLDNSGTIRSTGANAGVRNDDGSVIDTFNNSGLISGGSNGLYNWGGTIGTLNNSGTISGANGIYNNPISPFSATIGTISNSGLITSSSSYGINNNGTISLIQNNGGGTISGAAAAIYNTASGSIGAIANSGLISGNIVNLSSNVLTISGGAGSAVGTLTGGTITNTLSNLVFASGNQLLDDQVALGSGYSLIKSGSGTLIVTAAETYANATTITGGTLQIGNGGTVGSIAGDIVDNGNLAFDRSDNISYAGAITGSGSLTKLGAGTLTLPGGNTWGGNTTISAGTLALDSYAQSSSQTLAIGASSNASYGKLSVTNAATFNAGANLAVDVASANTLANGQKLVGVISAGTLNATTFNVTDDSALFNFSAVVNSGSNGTVDLTVSRASSIYDSVRAYSLTPAYGGARVLDTWLDGTPTGDQANVVTAFGKLPDAGSVARAAEQTLPQNFGSQAVLGALSAVNRLFSSRFAPGATGVSTGDETPGKQVWIKPFGSHANQDDQGNASGFSSNTWGLAVGYEGDVGKTRLGLAYAYADTNVSGNTGLSGADSGARIDTHLLGLYGSRPLDAANGLALGFQADTGWNSSRSTRNLSFGGLNRTADGSYGAWSAHAGLNLSKAVALDASNLLVPALRVDYTRLQSQAYGETGADALDLNVNGKTTQALVFGVDARLVHAINARSQIEASLGVGYDAINDAGDIVAAYAGAPSQSFLASGVQHSPWVFRGGLGYTYKTGKGSSVSLRYDAEGRTGYLNQSAMVKASWSF